MGGEVDVRSKILSPKAAVKVELGGTWKRVVPVGGGAVPTSGVAPGSISLESVTAIEVPAGSAELLLKPD